jgi:hypothetical protein
MNAPPDEQEAEQPKDLTLDEYTLASSRVYPRDGRFVKTLRLRACVEPGGRVSFVSPHLQVGDAVEADLHLPGEAEDATAEPERPVNVLKFLDSLPSATRTPQEWEEWEREHQQERDSWGR